MTDKQILFCREYIVDLNASAAAVRAGYSADSAKSIAHELLSKIEVSDEIQKLFDERATRIQVTSDDVLREFHSIGMSNIKDFVTSDFEVKPLDEIDFVKAKAIKSIKKTVTESEYGSKTVIEFQLHDKLSGLTNIGKHIGFFEKDNEQAKAKTTNVINLGTGVKPDDSTT